MPTHEQPSLATSLNISLSEPLKAFVETQVREHSNGSASEYIRELIRQAQKQQVQELLERRLLEGLRSEASQMTPKDWAELKRHVIDRAKKRRR